MFNTFVTRRAALRTGAGLALATIPPRLSLANANNVKVADYHLTAAASQVAMVGNGQPKTSVWAYNQSVPGTELRVRQGQKLRVTVNNHLPQATTVHWHGLRIPNAMDGVPHVTQPPIEPGAQFVYEFTPPDAGTYWYHPHSNSAEQIGRGLSGALIVEEAQPPAVDRDLIWILDDWRLNQTATIQPFGHRHDLTHGGRIGNVFTINGQLPQPLAVQAGERIRLRLINTANARHFALQFEQHAPTIIALDGQPVEPYQPEDNLIVLAPAMRTDLILDMTGQPEQKMRVIDRFYREAFLVNELVYGSERKRAVVPETPIALPANPLPEPDLAQAKRHTVEFTGGAMGGMRGAIVTGQYTDIRSMVQQGLVWAINGVAAKAQDIAPFLTLKRNQSVILTVQNNTAFPHPVHLHGHHYRVLSRNGEPVSQQPWQDSALLRPREQMDIAFKADNPGNWMFHCHIPEHMQAGMMGMIWVL